MRRTYLVLLIGHKTTVKKHRGEANITSASMNPIESPTVGFMLVLPLLFFYTYKMTLTAKMEDSIAKLKHFSKLDFQTKRKVINNGRPMPELKGTLQTKLKGMLLTFKAKML